jgi:hypothetical protein
MKSVDKNHLIKISGAGTVDMRPQPCYNPNYQAFKPTDPVVLALATGNAAFFGCMGGMRMGGLPGCVFGGSLAATGAMTSIIMADSYKMWKQAQPTK